MCWVLSARTTRFATYRPPEEFEQQSERGHPANTLGATVQFIVNDGNGENEERASGVNP